MTDTSVWCEICDMYKKYVKPHPIPMIKIIPLPPGFHISDEAKTALSDMGLSIWVDYPHAGNGFTAYPEGDVDLCWKSNAAIWRLREVCEKQN